MTFLEPEPKLVPVPEPEPLGAFATFTFLEDCFVLAGEVGFCVLE